MHPDVESLMADRNISDEAALDVALLIADSCKNGAMDYVEELLDIIKRHRPNILKLVADRLLSPDP
jgi:hypothetical protein